MKVTKVIFTLAFTFLLLYQIRIAYDAYQMGMPSNDPIGFIIAGLITFSVYMIYKIWK